MFLDCSRDLGNFTSFLTASVAISLVGLVLVFALVFVLSKVAIRPIVESYQKQKAFITDASHEIKTPLAVISAANEVQEMENGETEWSRSIAEQVKRLSGLTEQLVMLARMDEGASRFAKEDVDLSELVEEMAEPFYQLAEQRGKRSRTISLLACVCKVMPRRFRRWLSFCLITPHDMPRVVPRFRCSCESMVARCS